jgi:hypothetical protein
LHPDSSAGPVWVGGTHLSRVIGDSAKSVQKAWGRRRREYANSDRQTPMAGQLSSAGR